MTNRTNLPVDALPNLGPQSRVWLSEAGIGTVAELERLGAVVAYRLVKQCRPRASLNLLWALAAALQGVDWRELSAATKSRLLRELDD
ncbi:MAG TPA: TfoX/Sxy family DNA transformation protein [Pirellulales bacterium]